MPCQLDVRAALFPDPPPPPCLPAVLAASQLTAFQAMYKAAAKRYGVPLHPPLMEAVEAKLLDFKPLDKVPAVHGVTWTCRYMYGPWHM